MIHWNINILLSIKFFTMFKIYKVIMNKIMYMYYIIIDIKFD